jgi:hypothetical protein
MRVSYKCEHRDKLANDAIYTDDGTVFLQYYFENAMTLMLKKDFSYLFFSKNVLSPCLKDCIMLAALKNWKFYCQSFFKLFKFNMCVIVV